MVKLFLRSKPYRDSRIQKMGRRSLKKIRYRQTPNVARPGAGPANVAFFYETRYIAVFEFFKKGRCSYHELSND